MTQRDLGGKHLGITTFSTYGPLFRYLNSTAFGGDYLLRYSTQIAFLFSQIAIAFIFLRRCIWLGSSVMAIILLSFFNFPIFGGVPMMLVLWGWTWKGLEKDKLYFLLGWLTAWIWFFYKPGAGIIGFAVFFCSIALNPHGGAVFSRIRLAGISLIAFMAVSILYHHAFGGGVKTLIQYVLITLEDMGNYAHNNGLPLQTHRLLKARLAETPLWLQPWVTDKVFINSLWFFPLWLAINWFIWLFVPLASKRFWVACIAFPILFAEYKHSFVRADVTNIYGIFFVSGTLTVAMVIFTGFDSHWRKICCLLILPLVLMDWLGLTPYNIPWRHRRENFIISPWTYVEMSETAEEDSQKKLVDYLGKFSWAKDKCPDEIAGMPGALLTTKLGKEEYVFPTHQDYYVMTDGAREHLLNASLELNNGPKWLMWESINLDAKIPMANAPNAYLKLLANYDFVEYRENNFLLKKRAVARTIKHLNGESVSGTEKNLFFDCLLSPGQVLIVQSNFSRRWTNSLANVLLRGNVYKIKICFGEQIFQTQVSKMQLEKGLLIVPPLEIYFGAMPQRLKFRFMLDGSINSSRSHDLSRWFYDTDEKVNMDVENIVLE